MMVRRFEKREKERSSTGDVVCRLIIFLFMVVLVFPLLIQLMSGIEVESSGSCDLWPFFFLVPLFCACSRG